MPFSEPKEAVDPARTMTGTLAASLPRWMQVAIFAAVFLSLQWAWSQARGTGLEQRVIGDMTVAPAAWFINLLTPQVGAQAAGSSVKAPGGGINVINGCEGLDVLFMVIAAFCVYSTAWYRWLLGLVGGALLVWALNQGRVVGLFYASRHDKDLFALLHGTVAPLLLIALVALAFAGFVRWSGRPSAIV